MLQNHEPAGEYLRQHGRGLVCGFHNLNILQSLVAELMSVVLLGQGRLSRFDMLALCRSAVYDASSLWFATLKLPNPDLTSDASIFTIAKRDTHLKATVGGYLLLCLPCESLEPVSDDHSLFRTATKTSSDLLESQAYRWSYFRRNVERILQDMQGIVDSRKSVCSA